MDVLWLGRDASGCARCSLALAQICSSYHLATQSKVGEKRKPYFVDPDDRGEKKVELSFENDAVAPPKKQKKK